MPNVAGVLNLYAEVFNPSQFPVSELREKMDALLANPDYRLFTIEVDGKVVSTMMAVLMRNLVGDGRDQMVVENIATHPDFQRRGLGKLVYEQVEAWAKEKNCRKIIIVSNEKFAAGDFYRSLGFESESSSVYLKRL